MKTNAFALALCAIPATAVADMRGEVVCGIPPDEAVALVYEESPNDWRYLGVLGTNPTNRGYRSPDDAVEAHEGDHRIEHQVITSDGVTLVPEWEPPTYVCEVDIQIDLVRVVHPGRLYRLHRDLVMYASTSETGEPVDGDILDARSVVVGVASAANAATAGEIVSTDELAAECGIGPDEAILTLYAVEEDGVWVYGASSHPLGYGYGKRDTAQEAFREALNSIRTRSEVSPPAISITEPRCTVLLETDEFIRETSYWGLGVRDPGERSRYQGHLESYQRFLEGAERGFVRLISPTRVPGR